MSDWFEKRVTERKAAASRRRKRDAYVVGTALVLILAAGVLVFLNRGEDEATAGPPDAAPSPTLAPSRGITQEQLDKLGDSIEARYASGDNEIAQALLDQFMDAHPECVAAVMAGGEGRMRDVLATSEEVAEQLKATAPYPSSYTTVITTKDHGVVRAAVLGVSCEDGA